MFIICSFSYPTWNILFVLHSFKICHYFDIFLKFFDPSVVLLKLLANEDTLLQSRSQSFVPLDQRSENESSGSIHFETTMGNNRILVIRFTAQSQSASISCYGACLKWLLPELSFSDRWSRGTKLWERD